MANVAILALIPGLALAANAGVPGNSELTIAKSGGKSTPTSATTRATAIATKNVSAVDAKTPAKGADNSPKGLRMITTATAERIPLPRLRGSLVVSTDALARRVRLVPSSKDSATTLLSQVRKHLGVICPTAALKAGAIELTCRSGRFEAHITKQEKNSFLDLNELRGLPWRSGADAAPSFFYDPWKIGLGQGCPGRSPGARGECALQQGDQLQAAVQFRAALDTTARQLACVRLGDLAVATGDPITAAGWYRRSGAFGYFGRVAEARLCELDGHCLTSSEEVLKAFDPAGLPEPVRAESLMRAARAEAYMGRLSSAVHVIAKQVNAHGAASICRDGGELLCRRILLEGMQAAAGKEAATPHGSLATEERTRLEEMLDTYMAMPLWEKGPLAVELASAAAALAVRLGAPSFAGNLLASLAPQVPDGQLPNHLLAAAEAFVLGENWPRARIIAEYAQSRLGHVSGQFPGNVRKSDAKKGAGSVGKGKASSNRVKTSAALQSPRWVAVFRTLARHEELDELSPELRAAIEAEFTATAAELKNAREIRKKVESVVVGARAASAATPGKPGVDMKAPGPAPTTTSGTTGALPGKAASEVAPKPTTAVPQQAKHAEEKS